MLGAVGGLAATATPGRAVSKTAPAGTFEILAEGLAFPEGPVAMPDGSVILVELTAGQVTRCWNGRTEVVSKVGGGPNGAQVGPDGALYICNSGGVDPSNSHLADPSKPGRIERLDLDTGKVERLYDRVGDRPLSAPNDLVFDADGGIWFTDFGKVLEHGYGRGGVYYCRPDGSSIREIDYGASGYNGIGLSPDGKALYFAMNHSARLYRMTIEGAGEVTQDENGTGPKKEFVGVSSSGVEFDSLAVTRSGNVCIGTNFDGGITTISLSGETSFMPLPEKMVTNIAFGGRDMRDAFLTWAVSGRLVRMRWSEPGLRLNF
ncbi:MAG: SMP-30/gluconolactonase/LRE family protein [Novosphingobium sp.]|nr:SMP-30/gluconolactonase/LRE family protein [Novosphingobium sp.]MCP5401774.1 SMP-30/gluconolactonase/LRE family protein [Novosphingobium sp.]